MPPRRSYIEPTLRARFVKRAAYLKGRTEFWETLAGERRIWDERFPQFSIKKPSWPPEDVADDELSAPIVYPPALAQAVQRLDAHLTRATWGAEHHATAAARSEWRRLVGRLAVTWWPDQDFPPWRGITGSHPAGPFVSACLVWRREAVSEEWIARAPALTVSILAPEAEHAWPGEVTYATTYARTLDTALVKAAARGTPLTVDQIAELRATAETAAQAAASEVESSDRRTWPHVVPLIPGMTSTDWRELEPEVMRIHHFLYGRNPVHKRARRLHYVDGMSIGRIAAKLGLDETHASRIIKQPEED